MKTLFKKRKRKRQRPVIRINGDVLDVWQFGFDVFGVLLELAILGVLVWEMGHK